MVSSVSKCEFVVREPFIILEISRSHRQFGRNSKPVYWESSENWTTTLPRQVYPLFLITFSKVFGVLVWFRNKRTKLEATRLCLLDFFDVFSPNFLPGSMTNFQKRDMALEVWSSFISFIIREMKLGVFACDSFGPVSVGS